MADTWTVDISGGQNLAWLRCYLMRIISNRKIFYMFMYKMVWPNIANTEVKGDFIRFIFYYNCCEILNTLGKKISRRHTDFLLLFFFSLKLSISHEMP